MSKSKCSLNFFLNLSLGYEPFLFGVGEITVVLICKSILFESLDICPRAGSAKYCICSFCVTSCDHVKCCFMLPKQMWTFKARTTLKSQVLSTTDNYALRCQYWHFQKGFLGKLPRPVSVNLLPQFLGRRQKMACTPKTD